MMLTPRQALENQIGADKRNVESVAKNPLASLATITQLVADCAVRYRKARAMSGLLSIQARKNLDRATTIYAERMLPHEII